MWERALEHPAALTDDEVRHLLETRDAGERAALLAAAAEAKRRAGKDAVLRRGLIECSNRCARGCSYCGISRERRGVRRYTLPFAAAAAAIDEARQRGYGAVAFQAGEIESEENAEYYLRLLEYARGLEVTLSLGEQSEATYRRWHEAGALRYLLRIETTDRELYRQLHPADSDFDHRVECLQALKRLGYVTGTGVMVGLPGQSMESLVGDLRFFTALPADMVGLGPFVPVEPTAGVPSAAERLELTLRLIALVRLLLPAANVVAASALSVLDPAGGREAGLAAGANVIMPNLTPAEYRSDYALYPGKGAVTA